MAGGRLEWHIWNFALPGLNPPGFPVGAGRGCSHELVSAENHLVSGLCSASRLLLLFRLDPYLVLIVKLANGRWTERKKKRKHRKRKNYPGEKHRISPLGLIAFKNARHSFMAERMSLTA